METVDYVPIMWDRPYSRLAPEVYDGWDGRGCHRSISLLTLENNSTRYSLGRLITPQGWAVEGVDITFMVKLMYFYYHPEDWQSGRTGLRTAPQYVTMTPTSQEASWAKSYQPCARLGKVTYLQREAI